jgi:hypothetical protein
MKVESRAASMDEKRAEYLVEPKDATKAVVLVELASSITAAASRASCCRPTAPSRRRS